MRPGSLKIILTLCGGLALFCFGKEASVKPKYKITLDQAHKGSLKIDTRLLDSYGRPPENRRSFYLTARKILVDSPSATLTDPEIIDAAKKAGLSLMSGPMLGDVSEKSVVVWFRPVDGESLLVRVKGKDGNKRDFPATVTQPGAATRVNVTDLTPSTPYTYEIVNGKGAVVGKGGFHTAPAPNSKKALRIAFGSCFHKKGVHNPHLMKWIADRGNRAMLLLGDLAVDDREANLNFHYSDYLLRDVSQAWRRLSSTVPVYASWDDHDYLNNDKSGLQKGQITNQQRNAMRRLWQENWVNPQAPVEDRGIYFNTVIGDVEVIMLDTRSCRNWEKKGTLGSYLGDAQMTWLLATLKASKARFIIISSGTMWSDDMSKAKDSWGTWDIPGREKIFNFIETNKIGGVLLISGDRHGARGFRIERPSGFVLYEFEAATLGGVGGPPAYARDKSAQIFGYNGLKAFGEFSFDMSLEDPEVTFRLIGEDGKELEKHTFPRSKLTPDSVRIQVSPK